MRPSSAETSEPACTNRKMLSMNSNTSWPCSRKYSAIVRPDSATRMRAPGGSDRRRRDLRAGLHEPEDVVDEQQLVLALLAEVLGHRQAGQRDAHAGTGRLRSEAPRPPSRPARTGRCCR